MPSHPKRVRRNYRDCDPRTLESVTKFTAILNRGVKDYVDDFEVDCIFLYRDARRTW